MTTPPYPFGVIAVTLLVVVGFSLALARTNSCLIIRSSPREPRTVPTLGLALGPVWVLGFSTASAHGKKASEATTDPMVTGVASLASFAASAALRAAMRAASTRLIWPAPMPTVAESLA